MGATFSRLKNWIAEILTYADLNAEIDNILSNLTTSGVDDYSTNDTQMRTDTDGGESGSESRATSLAGEIERLRFAIREIKGSGVSYWYQSASTSLTEIASAIGSSSLTNRISSGRTRTSTSQPLFLVPNGAAASALLHASTTSFVHYIGGTQYTISANASITSLTAAPSSNNTTLVNMPGVAAQNWTKMCGEYGTTIQVDAMGSEISALAGKFAGFKIGTEYFIARVDSATQLSNARRGYFFDSADAPIPRETFSDNDTITLMKLTWIFATTAGALTAVYTNPTVSASQPTSPAFGDYWLDLATSTWKIYSLAASWDSAGASLVGITLQNTSNCVAARSFDFFKNHSDVNTLKFERSSSTACITPNSDGEITVYGTISKYAPSRLTWDITLNLDSGVTEASSTLYFCYVKESGAPVISNLAPYDRTADLKGLYHPFQPWRCVGKFYNNSSSDIVAAIDYRDKSPQNIKVISQVATSALTLKLFANPLSLFQLNAHNTTDIVKPVQIPCEISLIVSSGSTLGHASALNYPINGYVLNSSGTPYLGVSTDSFGGGGALSTTAEGGSGGADTRTIMYAQSALTSVPGNLFFTLTSNQTTAGTWAAVPTETALFPERASRVTVQTFTSGSGTYTTPPGVKYLRVYMVGGGGGASGNGTASGGAGTNGGDTTFGSSMLTAAKGSGGSFAGAGGAGGIATVSSPAVNINSFNGASGTGYNAGSGTIAVQGPAGANSFFGGGGGGGSFSSAGGNAVTNSGAGGGAGGNNNFLNAVSGSSGGAGAYVEAIITSPLSSYSYAVGAGGGGGAAGTNGGSGAGGSGAAGFITVMEYYS